jgi:hypothetical protein
MELGPKHETAWLSSSGSFSRQSTLLSAGADIFDRAAINLH